jgi:hypothetical protein
MHPNELVAEVAVYAANALRDLPWWDGPSEPVWNGDKPGGVHWKEIKFKLPEEYDAETLAERHLRPCMAALSYAISSSGYGPKAMIEPPLPPHEKPVSMMLVSEPGQKVAVRASVNVLGHVTIAIAWRAVAAA